MFAYSLRLDCRFTVILKLLRKEQEVIICTRDQSGYSSIDQSRHRRARPNGSVRQYFNQQVIFVPNDISYCSTKGFRFGEKL